MNKLFGTVTRALISLVSGAMLMTCLCLSVLVALPGTTASTATPSPYPSPQISATPMVEPDYNPAGVVPAVERIEPTDTPEPTPTAVPSATPTTTPTVTPTVAPTATPGFSEAEIVYARRTGNIARGWGLAFSKISDILSEASNNPALLLDNNWKIRLATQMVMISNLTEELNSTQAPPRFHNAHRLLTEAGRELDIAMTLMAESVDELNANKMNRATAHMARWSALVAEATDEVERMTP
jgi:hypothetical protein